MKGIIWFFINVIQALLIIVFTIIIATLALLITPFGGLKITMYITRHIWAKGLLKIVGGSVKVIHPENLDLTKSYIYVANHSSHFDIPILFSVIDTPIYFIAKKEIKYIPFFGWACSAVGMIWIDRKNKQKAQQSMLKAGEQIKNGKPIITFPEGTRSKDGKVNLFKRGAFIMAKNCDLDIMPICIINSRPLNPPKKFSFRPAKVTVIFGEPIPIADYKEVPAEKFAKDVEWMIVVMKQKYK
jgi:1-acyl-sn-glycerol-3-phosphate acyltransferase